MLANTKSLLFLFFPNDRKKMWIPFQRDQISSHPVDYLSDNLESGWKVLLFTKCDRRESSPGLTL